MSEKIISISELIQVRENYSSKKIILVSGCFDILHSGHVKLLHSAKKKADILVVAVLSDQFVRSRKGETRPYLPEQERVYIISSLPEVDYAVILDRARTQDLIIYLKPDFYGIGGDRSEKEHPERDLLLENKVEIIVLPKFGDYSTTGIVKKIKSKA